MSSLVFFCERRPNNLSAWKLMSHDCWRCVFALINQRESSESNYVYFHTYTRGHGDKKSHTRTRGQQVCNCTFGVFYILPILRCWRWIRDGVNPDSRCRQRPPATFRHLILCQPDWLAMGTQAERASAVITPISSRKTRFWCAYLDANICFYSACNQQLMLEACRFKILYCDGGSHVV